MLDYLIFYFFMKRRETYLGFILDGLERITDYEITIFIE